MDPSPKEERGRWQVFSNFTIAMKKTLYSSLLLLLSYCGNSQTYYPMPSSDATWRYRLIVIDDNKDITDLMLFVNGTDTVSGGQTYHKVFSRSYLQHVDMSASLPPVTDATASISDIYYGAYRESDKKVYLLTASGEQKIYDFNAVVGSSIPGYSGLITVTATDSILLDDGYHKRYKTTDTGYSVIEGVGTSRGLIPQFISGTGLNKFMCFRHAPVTYIAPMSAGVPCTYIAQLVEESVSTAADASKGITVYPVPAKGSLHITSTLADKVQAQIFDCTGRQLWSGTVADKMDIDVTHWPAGIYYLRSGSASNTFTRKIVIE